MDFYDVCKKTVWIKSNGVEMASLVLALGTLSTLADNRRLNRRSIYNFQIYCTFYAFYNIYFYPIQLFSFALEFIQMNKKIGYLRSVLNANSTQNQKLETTLGPKQIFKKNLQI